LSSARKLKKSKNWDYSKLSQINGSHPLKEHAPFSYVEYQVRKRKNGKVLYFNYRLAKEMGLITEDHPNKMNASLSEMVLDTFALIIINEHDYLHNLKIDQADIKPNTYMATRYLQMQHPDRIGKTSGDGRSMWNGAFTHEGKTWDVSSCGTGATCLSPAAAQQKKFFKSGDPTVSYGCGYAQRDEGITQAVFGEILHQNSIKSERTLAVIQFQNGYSVNVRVSENLLRPSHFFNHLKQGRLDRTKAVVDLFIKRQIDNKSWSPCPKKINQYDHMLDNFCNTFAVMAARFESEYIFCWLDWDGDNILADGTIIDYGSIRQFGLFHKDYRFDDGPRFSTNIIEQKQKAKYTVQTFAQMRDFLVSGKKKPVAKYKKHPILKKFDKIFEIKMKEFLLQKIGFEKNQTDYLLKNCMRTVNNFAKHFHYFERTTSNRAVRKVADGITKDVVFSMRDFLRELPLYYLKENEVFDDATFITFVRSSYASKNDLKMTYSRSSRIEKLQNQYMNLVHYIAKKEQKDIKTVVEGIAGNSAIINRFERVTGDAICQVVSRLLKQNTKMDSDDFHSLVFDLIDSQILDPSTMDQPYEKVEGLGKKNKRIVQNYMRLIKEQREGL